MLDCYGWVNEARFITNLIKEKTWQFMVPFVIKINEGWFRVGIMLKLMFSTVFHNFYTSPNLSPNLKLTLIDFTTCEDMLSLQYFLSVLVISNLAVAKDVDWFLHHLDSSVNLWNT